MQASLNKLIREVRACQKVDTIRETAYLDPQEKAVARAARKEVLNFANRGTPVPGSASMQPNGSFTDADDEIRYEHFIESNDTDVEPQSHNQCNRGREPCPRRDPATCSDWRQCHDDRSGSSRH